jgi:hypothetical protein
MRGKELMRAAPVCALTRSYHLWRSTDTEKQKTENIKHKTAARYWPYDPVSGRDRFRKSSRNQEKLFAPGEVAGSRCDIPGRYYASPGSVTRTEKDLRDASYSGNDSLLTHNAQGPNLRMLDTLNSTRRGKIEQCLSGAWILLEHLGQMVLSYES